MHLAVCTMAVMVVVALANHSATISRGRRDIDLTLDAAVAGGVQGPSSISNLSASTRTRTSTHSRRAQSKLPIN